MSERGGVRTIDAFLAQIGDASFMAVTESYLRYYAASSTHTAKAKRLDVEHFARFLAEHLGYSKLEKLKIHDWDFSSVQRFVEHSLAKGESAATVARRLATLKHMGRTLAERVAGFVNPARDVKPPSFQAPRPKGISDGELSRIRKRAGQRVRERNSFIRMRNETIFNFLVDTGLRADEVRLLKVGQLDEKLEWIRNVRTKGRRYRNVYITSTMRGPLQEYLAARAKELTRFFAKLSRQQDKALPLFISSYKATAHNPESFFMGAKTLWRAINELSSATPLHPHLLRHTYALDLLDASNDVRLVAQALGHSDVRTTMRYTHRVDEQVATVLESSRKKKKGKA